jgi:hypothetical protein
VRSASVLTLRALKASGLIVTSHFSWSKRPEGSRSPEDLPFELGDPLAQQILLDGTHQRVREVLDLHRFLRCPQPNGLGNVLVPAAREGQPVVRSGLALDAESLRSSVLVRELSAIAPLAGLQKTLNRLVADRPLQVKQWMSGRLRPSRRRVNMIGRGFRRNL